MAERLGTEATHAVLDRFFRLAIEEVERYGGTVDKFLGDGLLALFGVPRAHEDHARRCVLAALALRRRLAEDWPAELGPAPEVRFGVDTGTLLVATVGGGGLADHTVLGDTTVGAIRPSATSVRMMSSAEACGWSRRSWHRSSRSSEGSARPWPRAA